MALLETLEPQERACPRTIHTTTGSRASPLLREELFLIGWSPRCRMFQWGFLHVQIGRCQCILLDKLASRFDLVTHQRGENFISGHGILDIHL